MEGNGGKDERAVLYTIHCPNCEVLRKRLDSKGIAYEVCDDRDRMSEMGLDEMPMLEVSGRMLPFREAMRWIAGMNVKEAGE